MRASESHAARPSSAHPAPVVCVKAVIKSDGFLVGEDQNERCRHLTCIYASGGSKLILLYTRL